MVDESDLPLFTPSSSAIPFPGRADTNCKVSEARGHERVKGGRFDRTQFIMSVSVTVKQRRAHAQEVIRQIWRTLTDILASSARNKTQIILSSSGSERQNKYRKEAHLIANIQVHNHSQQEISPENTQHNEDNPNC